MLYTGRKVIALAITPEPLKSSRTPASWLTIQANITNQGPVYVGGLDETKVVAVRNSVDNAGLYIGHRLIPGDFCNEREIGGPTYLDLQYVYVAVDTDGDWVTFNYGRR